MNAVHLLRPARMNDQYGTGSSRSRSCSSTECSERPVLRTPAGIHGTCAIWLEHITGLQLAAIQPCAIPARVGPAGARVEAACRPREPEPRPERKHDRLVVDFG